MQDLIKPENSDIRIRENPESGVFISGAETVVIKDITQCQNILKLADKNRALSYTLLANILK